MTSPNSNLGGARTKGDRNEKSQAIRVKKIDIIVKIWKVAHFDDIIPSQYVPVKELGDTAIQLMKSIASRVDLRKFQELVTEECSIELDGVHSCKKLSWSGLNNIWKLLKAEQAIAGVAMEKKRKSDVLDEELAVSATKKEEEASMYDSDDDAEYLEERKDKARRVKKARGFNYNGSVGLGFNIDFAIAFPDAEYIPYQHQSQDLTEFSPLSPPGCSPDTSSPRTSPLSPLDSSTNYPPHYRESPLSPVGLDFSDDALLPTSPESPMSPVFSDNALLPTSPESPMSPVFSDSPKPESSHSFSPSSPFVDWPEPFTPAKKSNAGTPYQESPSLKSPSPPPNFYEENWNANFSPFESAPAMKTKNYIRASYGALAAFKAASKALKDAAATYPKDAPGYTVAMKEINACRWRLEEGKNTIAHAVDKEEKEAEGVKEDPEEAERAKRVEAKNLWVWYAGLETDLRVDEREEEEGEEL